MKQIEEGILRKLFRPNENINEIMVTERWDNTDTLLETLEATTREIKILTLNNINFTASEVEKLVKVIEKHKYLEKVDLSNNQLTSDSIKILANAFRDNKNIKTLSLSKNKIGDNGLKAFADIAENSLIKNIDFSDNNISDKGFEYWLAAQKNGILKECNFHNNKIYISDEGLQKLATLLPNVNIEDFTFTIGVKKMIFSPKIKSLLIKNKEISEKKISLSFSLITKLSSDELDIWEEVSPKVPPKWELIPKESSITELESVQSTPLPTLEKWELKSPVISKENLTIESESVQSIPLSTLEPEQQQTPIPKEIIVHFEQIQKTPEPETILKPLPSFPLIPTLKPSAGPEQTSGKAAIVKKIFSSSTSTINNYKKTERPGVKPQENKPKQEVIVENKFNQETLSLLDEYNKKFYSLLKEDNNSLNRQSTESNSALEKTPKALIILGNSTNDKNILTNLLARKTLEIEKSGGKLIMAPSKPSFAQDVVSPNKPVINIIKGADGLIVCDSNYPNNNLSRSEATVNALYLQKILREDTKFVFTVEDSKDKFTNVRGSDYEKEFLSQVQKLAILLEKIELTKNNFSFIVTSPLSYREKKDIIESIESIYNDYAPKLKSCTAEAEKNIVRIELKIMSILRYSIYIIPAFSHGELILGKELQTILSKSNIANKDDKITISSMNIVEFLSLQSFIKNGLQESINEISNAISKKWQNEKTIVFNASRGSYFNNILIPPSIKGLKSLIELFKKLSDNSLDKIADNNTKLLILNDKIYCALNNEPLRNKVSNYIDYLRYFKEENLSNVNSINKDYVSPGEDNWFKMLTDRIAPVGENVNEQLVKIFKNNIKAGEASFYAKLGLAVKNFCSSIKNIKKLAPDTLNSIYDLKNIKSIFATQEWTKSFILMETKLLEAWKILFLNDNDRLNDFIKYNIKVLNDVIIDPTPEILTEIWQGFTGLVSVTNIDKIIYDKLLTATITPNLDMRFYNQLEVLLEYFGRKDKLNLEYKKKMAEIYCERGSVEPNPQKAKSFYEKAIEFHKDNEQAHKKLGQIEFKKGNYKEALEHYYYTDDLKAEETSFKKVLKCEEAKEQNDENYDKHAQVVLWCKQAKYFQKQHLPLPNDEVKALIQAKSILKGLNLTQDYLRITKICEEIATIHLKTVKYLEEAFNKYKDEAEGYHSKAEAFSKTSEGLHILSEIINSYSSPDNTPITGAGNGFPDS
ncbi:hypothetical protein [Rickettsia endosymbiont of Halotydeus destructor]|uniref:hypothetical protein n=1 Tax=Rickettsia endosymbiont of Halotydeus destructor TaxID=2996754 RepID=UPI003BB1C5F6